MIDQTEEKLVEVANLIEVEDFTSALKKIEEVEIPLGSPLRKVKFNMTELLLTKRLSGLKN